MTLRYYFKLFRLKRELSKVEEFVVEVGFNEPEPASVGYIMTKEELRRLSHHIDALLHGRDGGKPFKATGSPEVIDAKI